MRKTHVGGVSKPRRLRDSAFTEKTPVECERCKQIYIKKRPWQRFHSSKCRARYHQELAAQAKHVLQACAELEATVRKVAADAMFNLETSIGTVKTAFDAYLGAIQRYMYGGKNRKEVKDGLGILPDTGSEKAGAGENNPPPTKNSNGKEG